MFYSLLRVLITNPTRLYHPLITSAYHDSASLLSQLCTVKKI
jgi:hypothetical protein